MNDLVDASIKLGQAGLVPILLIIILAMAWYIRRQDEASKQTTATVIKAYHELVERCAIALEATSRLTEQQTRAIEDNNKASEAATAAFEATTELITRLWEGENFPRRRS